MEELKFRAFYKGNMIYEPELEFCKTQGGLYIIRLMDDKNNFCIATTYEDNLKIMQFTGLYDMDEVEIYEGDILEHYINFGPGGDQPGYRTAVKLSGFGINLQHWMFYEKHKNYLPKIIGNIYDNRELLKEKK